MLAPWKKSYDQPRQHIKKQRHYFANKGPSRQSYGFSSGHVWMWELDHKENWAPKNWCFWTVVLEKTLESPLNCKEIQPVNPKGNQFWVFSGRTDAEAEAPIFWSPDAKNWLVWQDPDAGKDWRLKEKSLDDWGWDGWMASSTWWTWDWAIFGSWWWTGKTGKLQSMGHKELDMTEQLNWTELKRNMTWRRIMINWNPWGWAKDYVGLLWPLIIQLFNWKFKRYAKEAGVLHH